MRRAGSADGAAADAIGDGLMASDPCDCADNGGGCRCCASLT